ncbi:hypothetical protein TRVA0_009S02696 [Trichomonascus vanleenenianus]|uniref:uncharacterized protein n=1 Tax=Trichomonascus vanleenenianus TaxID=2268995 RepID=UPI003EC9A9BD
MTIPPKYGAQAVCSLRCVNTQTWLRRFFSAKVHRSSSTTLRGGTKWMPCVMDVINPSQVKLIRPGREVPVGKGRYIRPTKAIEIKRDDGNELRRYEEDTEHLHRHLSHEEIHIEALTAIAIELTNMHSAENLHRKPRFNVKRAYMSLFDVDNATRRKIHNDLSHFRLDRPMEKSFLVKSLEKHGYYYFDLVRWFKCIRAPTLTEAIRVMDLSDHQLHQDLVAQGADFSKSEIGHPKNEEEEQYGINRWPDFLIAFTLRRKCESRLEAIAMFNLYHEIASSPTSKTPYTLFKLFSYCIRIAHLHVPEMLPDLCGIFVKYAPRELLIRSVFNEAMWHVSSFGSDRSEYVDQMISQALKVLVNVMISRDIKFDRKGLLALAYALRKSSPSRSRALVQTVKNRDYEISQEELRNPLKFAYNEALYCMEMLLSNDKLAVIDILSRVAPEKRRNVLWATAIQRIDELGQLDKATTKSMYSKLVDNNNSPTIDNYLADRLLQGPQPRAMALSALRKLSTPSLSPRVLSKYLSISSRRSLDFAREVISNLETPNLGLLNTLIRGEALYDATKVWTTYQLILSSGFEPTVQTLDSLCIAAQNPAVEWGDLYAPQRVVVEFKRWVRGAHLDRSDAEDIVKVYPTQRLFHNYITMLGKSNYKDELLAVLPWMERIGLQPDKNCLCALIQHSPNGSWLMQHGRLAGLNYPTDEEYETYLYLSRR